MIIALFLKERCLQISYTKVQEDDDCSSWDLMQALLLSAEVLETSKQMHVNR